MAAVISPRAHDQQHGRHDGHHCLNPEESTLADRSRDQVVVAGQLQVNVGINRQTDHRDGHQALAHKIHDEPNLNRRQILTT